MRFDPQSAFMPEHDAEPAAPGQTAETGRRGLRGQVLLFTLAVFGVLGAWIWMQHDDAGGLQSAGAAVNNTPTPQASSGPASSAMAGSDSGEAVMGPPAPDGSDASDASAPPATTGGALQDQAAVAEHKKEDVARTRSRSVDLLEQGRQTLAVGRSADAINLLSQAVQLDPTLADAHYNLGLAYVLAGDVQAARQQRDALKKIDPNLASLLNNLVR